MTLAYVPELTASIGVTDMNASLAWYRNVLGFSLLNRVDEIGWSELSTGVPGVTLGLSQNETVAAGGGATNVWGVKDIDEAKAHLDAHGVKQDGDIQHVPGMVKLITFYDPDGNAMMFAQTLTAED
ncbi:VOC family protein [Comamonas sp. C11]|uniref:VOC family protein n=1 Tax=Comamonas sp. C11 TaxID=2966554 RepID=UPI0021126ABD|nr:VOC family protein [Comamonas sp. C11]UUC91484.1 VOC family protein [Comamonas sp. C11]